jgi:hypothetical protein
MFTVSSDLRNSPFNPKKIAKVLSHPGELFEFASFMAGINLPTLNYSVLIAAEQHPTDVVSISADPETDRILRNWRFNDNFREYVLAAFQEFLATINPLVSDFRLNPGWDDTLMSGAHHSGTCPMAGSTRQGIVDSGPLNFDTQSYVATHCEINHVRRANQKSDSIENHSSMRRSVRVVYELSRRIRTRVTQRTIQQSVQPAGCSQKVDEERQRPKRHHRRLAPIRH